MLALALALRLLNILKLQALALCLQALLTSLFISELNVQ